MCTAERLSIRRMGVLGAFQAVLDDLNFKFSQGEHAPLDLPGKFMLYCSVHSKEGQQTRVQTNYHSIHSYITSPYWWESKSVLSRDMEVMWENWKVRIDLANILQRSCKSGANLRTNAATCNAMILVSAISFFKKARVCTYHTLHTSALGTGGENYTA